MSERGGVNHKASMVKCHCLGNLGEGYTRIVCTIFETFVKSEIISIKYQNDNNMF